MNTAIIFATPVLLVGFGLLIKWLRSLSWREDIGFAWPRPGEAILWAIGFLVLALAAELVGGLAGGEDSGGSWRGKYDSADLAIRIVAVALIYPVAEEFFYRGALLGAVNRRFGPALAVAASSLIFALSHAQYDWRGMAFVLVDGLFFAFCRLRTGSLFLVMLFHIAGNSYAVWERIYG